MSFASRRFLVAFARAQALPVAVGLTAALVATAVLVDGTLVSVPGVEFAVPTVRLFPALLATAGALLTAVGWGTFERTGARPVLAIRLGRLGSGACVVLSGSVPVAANGGEPGLVGLTVALYLVLVLAAVLFRRAWWLLLPALLYAQVFVSDVEVARVPSWLLWCLTTLAGTAYLLLGPGGVTAERDLLPE